ncbi:MAG: acetolactate synthase 2 small subunit [Pseudomonadota bacterium]
MNALTIIAHSKPDCLERILQRVRHRGFTIQKLSVQFEATEYQIFLTVNDSRPIRHLITQIQKLQDIVDVQVCQKNSGETTYAKSA